MAAKVVTLAFFLFVAIFALNFIVLIVYFPPPTSQNVPRHLVDGRKHSSELGVDHKQHQLPPRTVAENEDKSSQRDRCFWYGCPRYPPELTAALNQTLLNAFQTNTIDPEVISKEPFASETFAMLTQQGKSHTENQDRALFLSPFRIGIRDTGKEEVESPLSFLAAIFDGHGVLGHLVAQEVVEQFPERLATNLRNAVRHSISNSQGQWWEDDRNDAAIIAALNETFIQVNNEGSPKTFLLGGCTASVAFRYGSKLYVANAGDSQTILVSVATNTNNKGNPPFTTNVEFMTRKDKPFEEDEKARIERMGGKIHVKPDHPREARVVVHSEAAKDTIALAMSRSLGDWEWKEVGVTAEPIVSVIDLTNPTYKNANLFLIAASDGMWDVRRREFFAHQLAVGFDFWDGSIPSAADATIKSINNVKMPSNLKLRPIFKLHDIVQRVTPKTQTGYRDDITAVIVQV